MPLLATYASASGRNYGARLESPVPTYSLTTSGGAVNVNEGSSLTFIVGGSFITDDTYYWQVNNITTANADFTAASGSFSIVNNSGTFNVTASADQTTEGSQTFTVSIYRNSVSGVLLATSDTLTINDTSVTPVVSISPAFGGVTSFTITTGATLASTSCGGYSFTPNTTFTAMVKCWGGGGGGSINQGVNIRSYGGGGGYYDAVVVFEAGITYTLSVGCGGGASGSGRTAGGGGGGTAVLRVTGGSVYMLGAGGGGGGGVSDTGGSQGGAGGGDNGSYGSAGGGGTGGGGGSQSAAGAGGTGVRHSGSAGSGRNGGAGFGSAATSGGSGTGPGGVGGYNGSDNGGGGGGGGYFGGGGGGGDAGGDGGGGGSGSANLTYVYNHYGLTGSGSTPGNSGDTDRGTAGQGGTNNTAGTAGKIYIRVL